MRLGTLFVCALVAASGCRGEGGGGGDDDDTMVDAGEEADAGPGDVDGGTPGSACDPYGARVPEPELFIGPFGLESKLLDHVDAATTSIDVMMYQFTRTSFVNALIDARNRGVTVRVLVDGDQDVNSNARALLGAAGVEVKSSPTNFTNSHSKVLIIDGREGIVMSANLSTYSMQGERNYGVIDGDPDDVADLQAIFDADWSGGYPDVACTRLLVAPINARARLLALVNGAQQSLRLAIMYVSDDAVVAALKSRRAAGVDVKVLLASPAWISDNAASAADLAASGIAVRYFTNLDLHAKLVIADGAAFVGSENMSWTSLNKNREVGLLVTEGGPMGAVSSQFDSDWNTGAAP